MMQINYWKYFYANKKSSRWGIMNSTNVYVYIYVQIMNYINVNGRAKEWVNGRRRATRCCFVRYLLYSFSNHPTVVETSAGAHQPRDELAQSKWLSSSTMKKIIRPLLFFPACKLNYSSFACVQIQWFKHQHSQAIELTSNTEQKHQVASLLLC